MTKTRLVRASGSRAKEDNKNRATLCPGLFWRIYRNELRKLMIKVPKNELWEAYKYDKQWTLIAMQAAKNACTCSCLGIEEQQTEYLRIDLIGYVETAGKDHDWRLKLAFEHENSNDWKDELCKLCHVVADLCVIVSYYGERDAVDVRDNLKDYVAQLHDRVFRVPGREWLFIFGPRCKVCDADPDAPFYALVLQPDGRVRFLADAEPLCPRALCLQ